MHESYMNIDEHRWKYSKYMNIHGNTSFPVPVLAQYQKGSILMVRDRPVQ